MYSTRHIKIALGLAGALLASSAVYAQENDVVARLGDREFTNADIAVAAEDLTETLQQLPADQREAYLLTYLADLERIARAAEDAGVEDSEAYKRQLEYTRNRTLMEAYLSRVGEEAATDEAARELYEKTVAEAEPQQEVKASHILVPTEQEAKDIKARLDEGGDFAELAAEHSKDPGSSAKGGDLGFFTKDQMVPEFAETAFALEPGAVSEPVESQFGWHVIKVDDKREQEQPTFEAVEGQLKSVLARQAQRDLIMSLREETPIEMVGQDGSDLATDEAEAEATPEAAEAAEGEDAPAAETGDSKPAAQ